MKNLLLLNFIPSNASLGILILRVWLGLSMLLLHGKMKLENYEVIKTKFMNFMGIGVQNSLNLAIVGEVLGALLLILGLFTRGASILLISTMAVAFFMAHQGKLVGEGNGELAFIYLAGFVALFFTGAGKYSVDAKLGAR